MRVVAQWAGMEEAEYDETLEASFAEREDGSGLYLAFQRELFVDDPYEGPDDENDRVNNTYCLTNQEGATWYGGLQSVNFSGETAVFRLSPTLAEVLKLEEVLEVEFQVPSTSLADFKTGLHRVVTWGAPSQIPEISGF